MPETSQINRNLSELEEELKNLKSAAELITEARVVAEKTIEEANHLSETSKELVSGVNLLVSKVDKIDFPSRLDKLDATVSGINSGMQNVIFRLESVERHFDKSLEKLTKEMMEYFKKSYDLIEANKQIFNRHKKTTTRDFRPWTAEYMKTQKY